jgi:hypothetical protein
MMQPRFSMFTTTKAGAYSRWPYTLTERGSHFFWRSLAAKIMCKRYMAAFVSQRPKIHFPDLASPHKGLNFAVVLHLGTHDYCNNLSQKLVSKVNFSGAHL